MSIRMMRQVWKPADEGGSPYEGKKLVLHLAFADFAQDDGLCWPSQDTLARKCRMSARWISKTVNEMERDGYLVRIRRGGKFVGSAIYRLIFPNAEHAVTAADQNSNTQSAVVQPEVSSRSTGTDFAQPISNHQEPSLLQEVFAALKAQYPNATELQAATLMEAGVQPIEIGMIVQSMRETFSKTTYATLKALMSQFPTHRPDRASLDRAHRRQALDAMNLDSDTYRSIEHHVIDFGYDPVTEVGIEAALEIEEDDHWRTMLIATTNPDTRTDVLTEWRLRHDQSSTSAESDGSGTPPSQKRDVEGSTWSARSDEDDNPF